jgi:hypothetical protein
MSKVPKPASQAKGKERQKKRPTTKNRTFKKRKGLK